MASLHLMNSTHHLDKIVCIIVCLFIVRDLYNYASTPTNEITIHVNLYVYNVHTIKIAPEGRIHGAVMFAH